MPKILLVEDNEMNREMLARRLARKGFEMVVAVDGLQGVALAAPEQPDLILMDLSLPGIDGWEATRRIKADAATCGIPVVALTAHAMADDRAKAMAAGCDEFDTKPVDLVRLLSKMEPLLAARGASAKTTSAASACAPGSGLGSPAAEPTSEATLSLPAVAASLPAFKTELEHFCMQAGISAAVQQDLQVVLDELCANVFKHAYAPRHPGELRMTLHCGQSGLTPQRSLTLSLQDQGRPFNPLARAAPDVSLPWQERPIGGLGIHLVQQLTDEQHYLHTAAEGNRLTLIRHLT